MRHIIAFLFSVIFISPAFTQITFDRTYSPDSEQVGREIFQTADGGYLIQATIIDNWNKCYLMKTDEYGDTIWTKTYGTDSIQYLVYDAIETGDGGYILAGDYQRVDTYPNMDSYIQKVDSLGNEVWFNKYGLSTQQNGSKDHAELIKLLDNGELIIEGYARHIYYSPTNIVNPLSWNGYISKFDSSNGSLIDIVSFNVLLDSINPGKWYSLDMEIINNTIYVLGYLGNNTIPYNWTKNLIAIDDNLDTLYTVKSGLNDYDGLSSTSDNHLILFGKFITSKMNTSGNIVWTSYNGSLSQPYEFIELSDGKLASIGGRTNIALWNALLTGLNWVVYLNKYDQFGNIIWSKQFSLPTTSYDSHLGYSLIETNDLGFAFVGYLYDDIWFVKTDSLGNVITSITYPSNSNSEINVYPNPSNGIFNFIGTGLNSDIEILNTQGQVVFKKENNNKEEKLDLHFLSTGFYYYKIYTAMGFSAGKLIKE